MSSAVAPAWITISGEEGPLRVAIEEALAGFKVAPGNPFRAAGPIHLVVHSGGLASLRARNRSALAERQTCLVVREEFGTAIVGPWLLPGRPGCHECLLARQRAAVGDDRALLAIQDLQESDRPALPGATWAGGPPRFFLAAIVAREIAALAGGETPRAVEAVVAVRLDTLETRRRPFLPHPRCPACSKQPDDAPELAMIRLRSTPKAHPREYHAVALTGRADRLEGALVDPDYGLITGWRAPAPTDDWSFLPMVSASLASAWYGVDGHGRGTDHVSARVVAICEALERYAGLTSLGKRTAVRGSFAALDPAVAVDPRRFGLPDQPASDPSGNRFARYSPELVVDWVWAFSFGLGRPVLVPEQIAYYGGPVRREECFVAETSNGCALGASREEAILHGLLEVAERDAFLLTWHARLPAPEIDLAAVRDRESLLIIERFQQVSGYRLRAYDITLAEGIPCVWVMAVDESDNPALPKSACSGGSSLDPERGLKSALLEMTGTMGQLCRTYPEKRERALRMLADPREVTEMEDHRLVNSLPEAWPRFFFLAATTRRRVETMAATGDDPGLDLAEDLRWVIGRYLAQGLDVLVVDQTSLEHRRLDLHCVKVIVPGTLPMTFGHHNRRLASLDRLRSMPARMGYHSTALTDAEINWDPHPFP